MPLVVMTANRRARSSGSMAIAVRPESKNNGGPKRARYAAIGPPPPIVVRRQEFVAIGPSPAAGLHRTLNRDGARPRDHWAGRTAAMSETDDTAPGEGLAGDDPTSEGTYLMAAPTNGQTADPADPGEASPRRFGRRPRFPWPTRRPRLASLPNRRWRRRLRGWRRWRPPDGTPSIRAIPRLR